MDTETEKSQDTPVETEVTVTASPFAGTPDILVPALKRRGFEKLTPVQLAIANADDGLRDLRISSQTGSGKTVAIGFSMVKEVVTDKRDRVGPTTLVIAPTRELAMQVKEELNWLFADLAGVDCEVVTGGTAIDRERMRLRRKPSVLVGTPGRLLDHLRRGAVDISSVKQLVLDEADQMLDLGFKDELDGILECLPEERRTHLVSATFPPAVLQLANRFQNQPIMVEGTAPGEAHNDIEHIACRIGDREHYQAVVNMLLMAGNERTLVFVRTREETTRMAEKLAGDGFAAAAINGDLAQAQRTRTLAAFRSGRTRTLIATDVAARGLDIPAVTMVIHVELPMDSSTYVHRSGRTGRAGQKGQSVLLVPKSRAQRTTRMFRMLRLDPRWTWAPNAELINKKQLERAEAEALTMLTAAPAATAANRTSAANLLRERDPIEVVAALLTKTMTKMRAPFEMAVPKGNYDDGPRNQRTDSPNPRNAAPRDKFVPRHESTRHDNGPRRDFTPQRESTPARSFQKLPADQRGTPGSAPSWQRPNQGDARPVEAGFTRFRINWGPRDGANPRRIMAHICRRGEVESSLIGSISMDGNATTFEVQNSVADDFAKRVQRRDRRDPHLIIHRETFNRPQNRATYSGHHGGNRGGGNFHGGGNFRGAGAGGYRGAMRTKQSR
jgi:ATP-dependent RNA helicase DeaD